MSIAATYVSSTQCTVSGNETAAFSPGRIVLADLDGPTATGTVSTSSYSTNTTVTLEESVLTSDLVSVEYGVASRASLPTHDNDKHTETYATVTYVDELPARKNQIINGNFDVWQRNTSQTSAGYGSDDRWENYHTGTTTKTHTRQLFTLGQTDVPNNPRAYSRTVVTSGTAVDEYCMKQQKIEGVRTFAAETATLSFYAKADSSKNIATEFAQQFGTGGSPSSEVNAISVTTHALTTSWQQFTVTVDIPSISGKTIGTNNDDFLQIRFWFDAGSNFNSRTNSLGHQSGTFEIAQVQLEKGSIATAFECRFISEELGMCQRFFEKSYDIGTNPGTGVSNGLDGNPFQTGADTNGYLAHTTTFKVRKHSSPDITIYDAAGNSGKVSTHNQSGTAADNVSYTNLLYTGQRGFNIYKQTAGNICGIEYHWTASAEL